VAGQKVVARQLATGALYYRFESRYPLKIINGINKQRSADNNGITIDQYAAYYNVFSALNNVYTFILKTTDKILIFHFNTVTFRLGNIFAKNSFY
jgi:hypothetical protein